MGRISNKKTGKLNKAYRDPTVFYSSSRGRKPNPWKLFRKKKKSHSKSSTSTISTSTKELSPEEIKIGRIGCLGIILIFIVIIFSITSCSKNTPKIEKIINLEQLYSESHPLVADTKDSINQYYRGYEGVSFEHLSDFKSEKVSVLTWHYTSISGDNTYNDIVIDFSKLSEEEQNQLTFEKVLDIAISFVPVDEILEYYDFDKAIYVEREDHISYELYYREIDEKMAVRPSKYSMNHGFSVMIKKYYDGHFKVFIESNWYDLVYDTNPTIGKPVSKEELASHQEWGFSLQEYMNNK